MAQKAGYSKAELYRRGPQITYTGRNLDEIAFPLGGIGTGMITLGGWGQLRDFEIMNRPAKGAFIKNAFFAIRVRQGKTDVTRALQGPVEGDFNEESISVRRFTGEGLSHFRKCAFRGEFPFAYLALSDASVPVKVDLTAWNPLIPLNADDSSIPAAIFAYTVKNMTKRPVDVTLFGAISNPVGRGLGAGDDILKKPADTETRVNAARHSGGASGLYMHDTALALDSPRFGSIALAALGAKAEVAASLPDELVEKIWEIISGQKAFPTKDAGRTPTGLVGVDARIPAGGAVTVPFAITWYFPNFEQYWDNVEGCFGCAPQGPTWRNWYATKWSDAWDVAEYIAAAHERLYGETKAFHDALFSSTLPDYVLDAVSANISILKSPTCLRLTDGTFYGFEGCGCTSGCCQGSCTHVWNYAQALPYLFPGLQRSQREADYKYAQAEDGFGQFRLPLPLGTKGQFKFQAAADGQMGAVMQVYREWLISGDTKWLKSMWPAAKRALEFAWKYWDADRDGVMEGMQHNTYDIEFYGPNTMMGSLYLGALLAGERMARIAGDDAAAAEYRRIFEKGSKWTDANLFNGEYYEQKVNVDANKVWPEQYRKLSEAHGRDDRFPWPKWQFGKGCLSDQLIGQWYAEMLGLGKLYDPKKVRKALGAIVKYNWRADLSEHPGLLRIYALRDEAGLIICTWPNGGRPGYPSLYADEVWCGVEYQVASHLIYEGFVDEGLAVTRGARERHRGDRRNPWDEFECGHHYARSMASYAVMTALAGFSCNMAEGRMGFAPRVFANDFRVFWSVGTGWGTYAQKAAGEKRTITLEVKYGSLGLKELSIAVGKPLPRSVKATVDGAEVAASVAKTAGGAIIAFKKTARLEAGQRLTVTLA
jgi:uncharacterized protein (DUF608 family)